MSNEFLLGVVVVVIAGFMTGTAAWPIKLMKKYKFEHYWFVGMLFGLIIMPWVVTLARCPHAIDGYASVGWRPLILSNLFSLSWGIANVLCGICFVRIGVALTGAVIAGLGVSLGVTLPMIVKGSGMFKDSANITSPAGKIVMLGVVVMLVGVVISALAGFGRDKVLKKSEKTTAGFLAGFIMAVIAGILSCGMSFAFVYSNGPIVKAMMDRGADSTSATFAVWAAGLLVGALINVLYPAFLLTRNNSWGVFVESRREMGLSIIIGIQFCTAVALMGRGMLMLGALGASIGFGIQQATQMLGGQCVGFISGEWKGIGGLPRRRMLTAIAVLIVAAAIMAYGNNLTR